MTSVFDENLPPEIAKAINELVGKNGIEVKHIRDLFPASTRNRNIRKNPHEKKAWEESQLQNNT